MPYKAAPIILDEESRSELERRIRAGTTPQRDVKRARIILLADSGMSSARIAQEVDMHEENVAIWRRRFLERGLDGLADLARSGGPLTDGHDQRVKLAALATSAKDPDDPVPYWTHESLAEAMHEDDIPISASQVGRILGALDIKPHRVIGWLNRKEQPEFWNRVEDVCGLYLNPPENALVVSVDEKTGIQAKERH